MMTVTPAVTIALLDTSVAADPNAMRYGGNEIVCPGGAFVEDVVLAANSSNVPFPLPLGVTTAKIVAVSAVGCTDLVVTYKGQVMSLPLGQVAFYYGVSAGDVTVSSVVGGRISYLAGG